LFSILVGLINLRKICNHPDIYDGGPKHFGTDIDEDALPEDECYGYWRKSGKMIVIESLLKLWKKQGHRVLLFTQSRQMLVILQRFVMERGYSYLKMDGCTSIGSRQPLIDKFNSSDTFVFLLTTKVGGLGVNLTGANRVVIFDPDWNPATDTQARERAWRIGQEKQVTIYRLMTSGTIEEKIYHRQIFKQFLVNRVLKDPKQRRFFKSNDLYELFTLNEGTSDRTETSAIFAGTGSDVRVSSKKKKGSTSRGDAERNHHPVSFKPQKKASLEGQKASGNVKDTIKKMYDVEEEKKSDDDVKQAEPVTERERLMAKVRAISKKIAQNADKEDGSKRKDKKHKKKEKKAKFEGQRVSHLVKTGDYKPPDEEGEEGDDEDQRKRELGRSAEQDNYVLSKLFKKSGVHSALSHDVIVGDGAEAVEDYELIETEAERVAKEAVDNLKASRRQCFRAEAGVPTWTGQSGSMARKPRFGGKKKRFGGGRDKEKRDGEESGKMFSGKSAGKMLSSSDLLDKMRDRNRFLAESQEGSGDNADESGLFRPDNSGPSTSQRGSLDQENLDLLADIRNFVAFQAAEDGRATTYELLEKFKER
jgi:DNA excision repair protein ERCC-6